MGSFNIEDMISVRGTYRSCVNSLSPKDPPTTKMTKGSPYLKDRLFMKGVTLFLWFMMQRGQGAWGSTMPYK